MEPRHRNHSEILWHGASRRTLDRLFIGVVISFLFLAVIIPDPALADSDSDRRIAIGIKLFRTMLAADLGLKEKTDNRGKLVLALFYRKDQGRAARLAEKLAVKGAIRELPISVVVTDDPGLNGFRDRFPAGIFLTERPRRKETLDRLVSLGKRHGVIVYSPFEGHVEQGVTGGIYITNRVQPYVNTRTIGESGIRIKKFFMKVAKEYE